MVTLYSFAIDSIQRKHLSVALIDTVAFLLCHRLNNKEPVRLPLLLPPKREIKYLLSISIVSPLPRASISRFASLLPP